MLTVYTGGTASRELAIERGQQVAYIPCVLAEVGELGPRFRADGHPRRPSLPPDLDATLLLQLHDRRRVDGLHRVARLTVAESHHLPAGEVRERLVEGLRHALRAHPELPDAKLRVLGRLACLHVVEERPRCEREHEGA